MEVVCLPATIPEWRLMFPWDDLRCKRGKVLRNAAVLRSERVLLRAVELTGSVSSNHRDRSFQHLVASLAKTCKRGHHGYIRLDADEVKRGLASWPVTRIPVNATVNPPGRGNVATLPFVPAVVLPTIVPSFRSAT